MAQCVGVDVRTHTVQQLQLLDKEGVSQHTVEKSCTNTLRQLLTTSTVLRHLRFQFVDTLNDEVGM